VEGGLLAKQAQFELRRLAPKKHLQVGAIAPATTGKDLDGKPLSLSDFKGKVVVLEFWGSWCGPCIRAVPGLKSVAKEYADRDVVILGVMSEEDPADAREVVADLKVPWRNWLDPRDGAASSIVSKWEVLSFPTTVVIDRAGVVQAVNPLLGREGLENALNKVLAADQVKR
jgi:thiol-disulfide isomerase/thioredoxin